MACTGCNQRRENLGAAAKAAATGDLKTAVSKIGEVGQSMRKDAFGGAQAVRQRLAAAHSRLKR